MSPITHSVVKHAGRSRDAPLDSDLIAGLLRPEAYPHPVDRVELVETHISWVLLTGEFAYKVKKPVELGFLDFRELDRRRFFCEEEVRLNRFWAPELYLDVVPIGARDGHPAISGNGPAVEYAVRMRQFEQSLQLDHQLEAERLTGNDMLELAGEIAARHQAADRAGPAGRLLLATKRLMWDNFDDLFGEIPNERRVTLPRMAAGDDASEADLEVLQYQLRTNEPLTADEARHGVTVGTVADVDVSGVIRETGQRAGR